MKLGFTGTRKGMSAIQLKKFAELLCELKPTEFHHGGCEGADTEASNWIAGSAGVFVVCHPPADKRAIGDYFADQVSVEKDYLSRNRDIVDATDCLVATPKEDFDVVRSGTWYTVRYARKLGKKVIILKR